MEQLIFGKKNLAAILILLFLLVAIPVSLYLVRQQQILKGRAAGSPPMEFFGSGVSEGNPPITTSQTVQLKLTYGGTSVTPTPTPTATPTVTTGLTNYRLSSDPNFGAGSILAQGPYTAVGVTTAPVALTGTPGSLITIYAQFFVNGQWVPVSSVRAQIRLPSSTTPAPSTPRLCNACDADLNNDHTVNFLDVSIAAICFRAFSPSSPIGLDTTLPGFQPTALLCRKVDLNVNNRTDQEEVNCVSNQSAAGGTCTQ